MRTSGISLSVVSTLATALLVTGCPKKSARSDAPAQSGPVAAPSASSSTAVLEQLPPPTVLAIDPGADGGTGTRVIYSQRSEGTVSMASVDAKSHRAILRIDRVNDDRPPQLVTIDLAKKAIVDTWSPTPIFQKVIRVTNMAGPKLADSLGQAPAFRADLVGWATRVAAGGDPWNDSFVATCPGVKHITFTAGFSSWVVGADDSTPRDLGAVGHASLSPSCRFAAWSGIDANATQIPARLFLADLDTTTPGAPVADLSGVEDVTWSPDGTTIYVLAKGSCLHAVDVKTRAAKPIACNPGHQSTRLLLSNDGKTGVLSGYTQDPAKLYTDLVFLTLPAGTVRRKVRIPVIEHSSLIDDAGLFVTYGYNHGQYLVRVDLATGTQRITDDEISSRTRRRLLESTAWYGPRTIVGLRQSNAGAVLEEIALDELPQVTPDKMPEAPKATP